MRICLVAHGFPPLEQTGVENYTAALARALVRCGHAVEVFAPRRSPDLPELSVRREQRQGFGVTWLTTNLQPEGPAEMLDLPGAAQRFRDFLDRERPQVVHFQHVVKLGVGLLEQAAALGIPCVYTAHDFYAVCHRYTLLRPDLARCDTIGEPDACARCDLALSYLNGHPELGDYQMGALPEQLAPEQLEALGAVLAGDPGGPFDADELEAARRSRAELDQRRAEAFAAADLVIAPTRFLANALERGGLDAARIRHLPYGIDASELSGLKPVRADRSQPVRFAFLGSITKQKGIHVLVDAFHRLTEPAELSIWGGSTDTAYSELVRRDATDIRWRGPYGRAQLRGCLEQADVVVVPSIWYENYPIVIREAFAAGRPVIASRTEALAESVQHERDGLLFEPGDAAALALAMSRCLREDDLVEELARGIQPVKDIDEQARELTLIYEELATQRLDDRRMDVPPSVSAFAERFTELESQPTRELFRGVLERLARLRAELPSDMADASPERILEGSLGSESHAKILLRDRGRAVEWLESTLSSRAEAERSLSEKVRWEEEQLREREQRIAWLQESIAAAKKARSTLEGELRWQQDTLQSRESELEWLRKEAEGKETELDWLREEAEGKEKELVWLRKDSATKTEELSWLRETLEAKEVEGADLRKQIDDARAELDEARRQSDAEITRLHGLAAEREARLASQDQRIEQQGVVLGVHAHRAAELRDTVRELASACGRTAGTHGPRTAAQWQPLIDALDHAAGDAQGLPDEAAVEVELARLRAAIEQLGGAVDAGMIESSRVEQELDWRRSEMLEAVAESDRRLIRLLLKRAELGQRLAGWAANGAAPAVGPGDRPDPATEEGAP